MYEKLHRTKSGRDYLHINHLSSYLKFLALFIECLRWFFSCAYPDLSLDAILSCWSFKSCICLFSQILHLRKNNQVSTTTTEPSKSEFETYKKTGGDSEMRIETFQDTQWNLGLIYQNTEWIQSTSGTEENSTGEVTEHFRTKNRGSLLCLLGEVRRFPETFPNIVK